MNCLSKVSVVLRSLSFMTKRQMAKKKILFILTVSLLFAACATTDVTTFGKDFDKTKTDSIVKGQTTKQEIVQLLGEPHDKTLQESGTELWVYLYQVTEITTKPPLTAFHSVKSEGTVKEKKLEISFDQDVVKNFVLSESTRPVTGEQKTKY